MQLCLLLLSGGFFAGVGVHAVAAVRGSRRVEHGLLAAICLWSAVYLLIESRLMPCTDIALYERWFPVARGLGTTFVVLQAVFLAVTTGARVWPVACAFGTAAAVVLWHNSHGASYPWLARIDRLEAVALPWGETMAVARGPSTPWLFLSLAMWAGLTGYAISRAVAMRGTQRLIGARALLWSNAFIFIAIFHDALVINGVIGGPFLNPFIPAALTAGVWWRLSLLDRQRADWFRDLYVRAGDAILVFDSADGRVADANEAACSLFRARRDRLIGSELAAIMTEPMPPAELREGVDRLRAGATMRERRLRRADGEEFTAEVSLSLARLEGHERIIASYRDLTDRQRVERALVENERRLRSVIARSPLAIVEAGLDGGVTAVNPRFAELFGAAPTLAAFPAPFAEADGRPRLEAWRLHLAAALAGDGVLPAFRTTVDDRHGVPRRVEICGVAAGAGAVLFITDLSDVIAARDEIARREAFYRVLVEVAADGICVLSWPGPDDPSVAVWNPRMAEITGIDAARAVGSGWLDAIADGAARERLRELLRLARDGELRDQEWELVRPDGARRSCSLAITALPGGDGGHRALLTLRDVTARQRAESERRRADAQLRHAQKLESLAILAGGVAHDFNNILMTILGRAGIAASRLAAGDPARSHLRDMEQASRRAAQLCQQLLAYAGKGRTRSAAVDTRAVVDELARVLSVSTPRVRFSREFARDVPAVHADENQLRQVIMNLITNAAESMWRREGTIALRVAPRRLPAPEPIEPDGVLQAGDYVAIEVADEGCGMDAVTRRRMFEPFFTTKPEGRGLGMAAVLGIVRAHGGGLQIESEPGHGTTVRVLLPSFLGPAGELTPLRVAIAAVPAGTTVLVVDDERSVRSTTGDMLRHLGCEVLEAASGGEALERFAREHARIHAVVLDLTMPDLDGAETFRRLRAVDPRIQVVLASGYSRDEVVRSLGTADIAGFLQKPYDVDALAVALHAALAVHRS